MRKQMKKLLYGLTMLCVIAGLTCMFFPSSVQAASAKSKALKAYKQFLSKNIEWDGAFDRESWDIKESVSPEECEFALVYVDKDSVPELVVFTDNVAFSAYRGHLYTYKNGKVRLVECMRSGFSYYKKTGIFCELDSRSEFSDDIYYKLSGGKSQMKLMKSDETEWAGDNPTTYYYRVQKGKVKDTNKKTFKAELKKLSKGKKASKPKYYRNTAENRNKRLK